MAAQRNRTPSFVRTGQRIEQGVGRLEELYRLARELCPDEFIAEETRLDLYCGDDPNTLAFLELGGVGVVSVTVFPQDDPR